MPKDLIRRLVLLDALFLVLGLVLIGATADPMSDFELRFAEFAIAQGEAYEPSTDANLVGYLLAFVAYVFGWIGLWRHRRWGVPVYAGAVAIAVLAPMFEASTITYGKTLETAWEAGSMLLSGLLIGVAAVRLNATDRSPAVDAVALPPSVAAPVAPSSIGSNAGSLASEQIGAAPASAPAAKTSGLATIRDLMILGGLGGVAVALVILKFHRNAGTTTGEAPGLTLLTGLILGAVAGGVLALILTAVEKNLAAKARSR